MTIATMVNTDPIRFQNEGYCVPRAAVPQGLIDEASRRLDTHMAGLTDGFRPEWLVEPHLWAPDWQFWLELCRHPTVLDQVAACLRCSEITLLMTHLIVKPPHDGLPILWHQDNTYWPSVEGTDVVTVWLALDDVDLSNGAMTIIPCSHAGYPALEKIPASGANLLQVRVEVSPAMEAAAVAIELPRGHFSVHDSFVIHGSQANRSARRRAGYTMRYGNAATVQIDLATHGKPVYYLRGDGANLRSGVIDLRPGVAVPSHSGAPAQGGPSGAYGRGVAP